MASVHGKGSTLVINSGAMTAYINDVAFPRTTDTSETTVLGLTDKTYVPGLNDGTLTGAGFYDSTASTGPVAILEAVYAGNAAVTVTWRPAVGSGHYSYAFSAILTDYELGANTTDAVALSFALQKTGAVTVTTQ